MAAVTVHSDFGAQENKVCHCFHFSLIYLPWSDGTRFHDLSFWMLIFKSASSLYILPLIKRLFSSFLLSTVRVISSAYLRLLIFLLAILIPACNSFSLAFRMMYSAQKLNKQDDNIQSWCTPFPILNPVCCSMSVSVSSWPAPSFLRRQVRWSGIPISSRIFHSLLWSTESKALTQSIKQKWMFFWNSLPFSMIQQMLAIWFLVPLPFLNSACTSGISQFTYHWRLAWRILSITLLACEMSTIIW